MSISATLVKELRDKTGAGFLDAKKALEEVEGNLDKAVELLRQKGMAAADKKMSRIAAEGLVGSYIHNGKIGVLIEVNCETDFVARNEEFQQLVKDICLQIASSAPEFVSREEIPASIIEEEKRIESGKEDLKNKPAEIRDKIVQGRVDKMLGEKVLLEQNFVKDPSITIQDLIKQKISTIGEKITIRRFTRYVLGEGLEKRQENFAEEVMKEMKK